MNELVKHRSLLWILNERTGETAVIVVDAKMTNWRNPGLFCGFKMNEQVKPRSLLWRLKMNGRVKTRSLCGC